MDPTALPQTDDVDVEDSDALMRKMKRWFGKDREHSAKWREKAKEDYDFRAGEQWSDDDKQKLKDAMRPVINFNRIGPLLTSVSGEEINQPQEVRFMPRQMGGDQMQAQGTPPNLNLTVADYLTSAAEWFRDECEADDEESEAFLDACTCGMGWTDTRLDTDTDPSEPNPLVERIDPIEMFWDATASRRNLEDRRRDWRVRTMPRADAEALFPDAAIEDLNASWADDNTDGEPRSNDGTTRPWYSEDQGGSDADREGNRDDNPVVIAHVEWWERETFHAYVDPFDGSRKEASPDDFETLKKRTRQLGLPPLVSAKLERKVYKEAFLGKVPLKTGPCRYADGFTRQCMTGFRDRNKGTWYGLVRGMKDPQRWANKWLSQTMHIMNTNAKGGVMVEADAVEDVRDFETSFAKSESVTWVRPGGAAKITPKPSGTFPTGFYQLMEFAVSSIRDVTGINVEMIGQREGDQPATLEYMRTSRGIVILAHFFRSKRRYHRTQGKVLLYYIQNYLADGRLIRIVGKDGAAYVPLMRQASVKYDIVVDEGPSSPNQKERVWQLIGDRFWTLPPDIQKTLLKYSPFPKSVIADVEKSWDQAQQAPQAQLQQRMMQMEAQLAEMKVHLTQAQAQKTQAQAAEIASKIGGAGGAQAGGAPDTSIATAQIGAQADILKHREKLAGDAALERMRTAGRILTERVRTDGQMTLDREHQALERERTMLEHRSKMAGHVIGALSRPSPMVPVRQ